MPKKYPLIMEETDIKGIVTKEAISKGLVNGSCNKLLLIKPLNKVIREKKREKN